MGMNGGGGMMGMGGVTEPTPGNVGGMPGGLANGGQMMKGIMGILDASNLKVKPQAAQVLDPKKFPGLLPIYAGLAGTMFNNGGAQ